MQSNLGLRASGGPGVAPSVSSIHNTTTPPSDRTLSATPGGRRYWALLVLPVLLCLLLVPGGRAAGVGRPSAPAAPSATFTVTNTGDGPGCGPSACSLRGAILAALTQSGPDTIEFSILTSDPGYDAISGQWTLALTAPLPVLGQADALLIDATTLSSGTCTSTFVIDATAAAHAIEITGTHTTLKGLVLANASVHGLLIHGPTAQGNTLLCSQVVSNAGDGIRIAGNAARNQIGLMGEAAPNVIAHNGGDGIEITSGAHNNTIAGNHIGTDLAGASGASNADHGIRISAGAMTNTIGAVSSSYSNLISGNAGGGVLIVGTATQGNVIQNNRIGPDAAGTAGLGTQPDGVTISNAQSNTVGPANTISAHTRDGVHIEGADARGNVVQGNHIGTTSTGDARLTNRGFGVMITSDAHHNQIGTPLEGNVISGNGYFGEHSLYGGVGIVEAHDNLLCNNRIGTSGSGTYVIPNAGSGVWMSNAAHDNDVGIGTQAGCSNTVSWNEGCGVCIEGDTSIRNIIGHSSIHDNNDLGIENMNGGNQELAPPEITSYALVFGLDRVEAEACPNCTIHVYSADDGEGKKFEGSGNASATGEFTWIGTPGALAYTLLAIDTNGNTSEFSASPAQLTLTVDDALPDVMVNKVAGDADTPAEKTIVEVVADVVSWDPSLTQDIDLSVTVPGDLFGAPVRVFERDDIGELTGTSLAWTDVGGGLYRADAIDLLPEGDGIYRRRVVFRFEIPHSTPMQQITLSGLIQKDNRPIRDPEDTAELQIVEAGGLGAIIVTNRTLLYQKHTDADVTALLNQLFTESQGAPASYSPLSTIYYVDAYSPQAKNWDNTSIDYSTSTSANTVARAIDGLFEDWHEDATQVLETLFFELPLSWPTYLLIVGDDDIVPFHRYYDPKGGEGLNLIDCDGDGIDEHPGWCTDSALNPAVYATDLNYFFTDNLYGDRWGNDWAEGDIDLAVGRILGETAADMLSLLVEGVDPDNGQRGGVVVASVSGWELGLEPHDPNYGGIPDIADVPMLFRDKGFVVRNDDIPTTEVQTIDVMEPMEGGEAAWNAAFVDAANDPGGMDLFFIGGHNGYGNASIPGDNFTPSRTCSSGCNYERFDDDHPVTVIVGCHGGLPVPDIDVSGGVDHDMVYDVIHEGGRAFIGATGYSYGTMDFLHSTECGEALVQGFFDELLAPAGSNSMTIGYALAWAKRNYVFGYVSDAADRKTVTEFQLYGVPWAFLYYPTPSESAAAPTAVTESITRPAYQVTDGAVASLAETGVFTRTFAIEVDSYQVITRDVGGITYDLLTVAGGQAAVSDGYPILPYIEAFTLTLPMSATVSGINVTSIASQTVGPYNVPSARMRPWTHGGTTLTTTTAITGLYPSELVTWQRSGDDLLFTFFPLQHDPQIGETIFHSRVSVDVIYETPSDIVVTGMAVDREITRPGDVVSVRAAVANLIDGPLALTSTLSLRDAAGAVIGVHPRTFVVAEGAHYPYLEHLVAPVKPGAYQLTLTVWHNGEIAGGAATRFRVIDGRVAPFVAPASLAIGEEVTFHVGYQNYCATAVSAQIRILLQDDRGIELDVLGPKELQVPAASEGLTSLAWHTRNTRGRSIIATVIVTVGDQTYGPVRRMVPIIRPVFLPIVMRSAP